MPFRGLMSVACTDGGDRFGAESPATGLNLEFRVRLMVRLRGQDLSSAVLSAFVQR